ncbi:MAG: hypothetical protein H0Z29_08985 [Candidatus Marinimicrobia bacterium]|nr:hypothetical protein [Candidatus Neomarinimicrobiota bacterium]
MTAIAIYIHHTAKLPGGLDIFTIKTNRPFIFATYDINPKTILFAEKIVEITRRTSIFKKSHNIRGGN